MLEKVEEVAEDREVKIMGAWIDEWMDYGCMDGWCDDAWMDVYFPLNDKMDFDRK